MRKQILLSIIVLYNGVENAILRMFFNARIERNNSSSTNVGSRDGSGGGKSQIVRTPLRVKHDSAGKPDWIFFARFESIYGRAKIFK